MKHFTFLLFFLFSANCMLAQVPDIQWQKCFGGSGYEEARVVRHTVDGGYVLAGYTNSLNGNVTGLHGIERDFWIVKVDSSGGLTWQKTLGGTNAEDAYAIEQTGDAGYVIAGYSSSNNGDVSGHHGTSSVPDEWIVKLNSSAQLQWQESLGGTGADLAQGMCLNYLGTSVVAGWTDSHDGDVFGNHFDSSCMCYNTDVLLSYLDGATGTQSGSYCRGGQYNDKGYAIDEQGGLFYVAGNTSSDNFDVSGNHNNGIPDLWVMKTDDGFGIIWQKCLGGTGEEYWANIQATSDGGCIVCGFTYSDDGDVSGKHGGTDNSDAWVVKLDVNGVLQWQRCLGGSEPDRAYEVRQTYDGGYIMVGQTESEDGDVTGRKTPAYADDIWLVKLDESGNISWQKCLGGSGYDYGYSVKQTTDGGYVVAGASTSNSGDVSGNHGNLDYWIVKLTGAITLTTTHTDPTCPGSNGTIDLTVAGGIAPYTYHWSNGKTTQDLNGLAAGDYTVTVTDNGGKTANTSAHLTAPSFAVPVNLSATKIKSTSAVLNWTPVGSLPSFIIRYRLSTVTSWILININNPNKVNYKLTLLNPSSTYQWEISEKCGNQKSAWSALQTFTTPALKNNVNADEENLKTFTCYPNPTNGNLSIEYTLNDPQNIEVIVVDLSGRIMFHEVFPSEAGICNRAFDLRSLSNGSYLVRMNCRENSFARPLLIVK